MKRPTKIETELANARTKIANLENAVDQYEKTASGHLMDIATWERKAKYTQQDILNLNAEVQRLQSLLISREACIGRLCIDKGVIR